MPTCTGRPLLALFLGLLTRAPTHSALLGLVLLGGCSRDRPPERPDRSHPPGWTLHDEAVQTFGSGSDDPLRQPPLDPEASTADLESAAATLDPEAQVRLPVDSSGAASIADLVSAAAARFGLEPDVDSTAGGWQVRFEPAPAELRWGVLDFVLWANGCNVVDPASGGARPRGRLWARHVCNRTGRAVDPCDHQAPLALDGASLVTALFALRHPELGPEIFGTLRPWPSWDAEPRREVIFVPQEGLLVVVDTPDRLEVVRWVVDVLDALPQVELRVVRCPQTATIDDARRVEEAAGQSGARVFVVGPGGATAPAPGEPPAWLYLAGPPEALDALEPLLTAR